MKTRTVAIWVVCIAVLVVLLSWNHLFPQKSTVTVSTPDSLHGIQTGNIPWAPELPHLLARLKAIGLPALSAEGNALHIHQHIDLVINNATTSIPAEIGINEAAGFISPIHTHDTSGIVHVESNIVRDFTLGQVFDIWGVRFSTNCIGSYCADAMHSLRVYVNGTQLSGDFRGLVLAPHQEIMVVYGPASSTPKAISSFTFPPGY
jgi:hypothetical protein